jgi:hypothetical protein
MKTYKNHDVYNVLLRKYFIIPRNHSKDHKRLVYKIGDHILARTHISHGSSKDLSPALFRKMAEECHLSPAEFERFIECAYSAEDYRAYQEKRLAEILKGRASCNPRRDRN